MEKVIIIGSGPSGYTAGIYTARADLKPLIIAGIEYGGQLMGTTEIENFPGFPEGIEGPLLMMNMRKQAEKFGARVITKNATKVELSGDIKKVWVGDEMYESQTVIIATGATPKRLGIPGEDKFYGRGVSTCATCDAAFYRGKVVAVVGGGDSAGEESTFIARFASKVYLIVRRDEMRASKAMQHRVTNTPNLEILWNTEPKEILGDTKVTGAKMWNNKENKEFELIFDGFFLAIGHKPATDIFKELPQNEEGYLLKNEHCPNPNSDLLKFQNSTNIPGVFLAGDVEDHIYRQAITAAAEGCKAAIDTERYLESIK